MKEENSTDIREKTIKIEKLTNELRGLARIDGKVIFVSEALAGEEVKVKITKRGKSFDEARVDEVITPSASRVVPPCPVAIGNEGLSICGGCQLQYMSDDSQKIAKQQLLFDLFPFIKKWGEPILGENLQYRGKARVGINYSRNKEKVFVGFREYNSNKIVDINKCIILEKSIGEHFTDIAEFINTLPIKGKIPQVEVATSYDKNGVAKVALVFRVLEDAVQFQAKFMEFGAKFNFDIFLQPKGLDSVYSLTGKDYLEYSLTKYDITMLFKPVDFVQVNYKCNQQMIERALGYLDLQSDDKVLDLFAGIGNFSLPMAKTASVISVEGEPAMTERCKFNASKNDIKLEAYTFNLADEEDVRKLTVMSSGVNKILIDPPRTGAYEVVSNLISKIKPKQIVYVSCNPMTLQRDACKLIEMGYEAVEASFIDMFHHTTHMECVMSFIFNDKNDIMEK